MDLKIIVQFPIKEMSWYATRPNLRLFRRAEFRGWVYTVGMVKESLLGKSNRAKPSRAGEARWHKLSKSTALENSALPSYVRTRLRNCLPKIWELLPVASFCLARDLYYFCVSYFSSILSTAGIHGIAIARVRENPLRFPVAPPWSRMRAPRAFSLF